MTGARPRLRSPGMPNAQGTVIMRQRSLAKRILGSVVVSATILIGFAAVAQERLPWDRTTPPGQQRLGGDEGADRTEPGPAPYGNGGYGQPGNNYPQSRANDAYTAPPQGGYGNQGFDSRAYRAGPNQGSSDAYRPPAQAGGNYGTDVYRPPAQAGGNYGSDVYQPPAPQGRYGEPNPSGPREPYDREYGDNGPPPPPRYGEGPQDDQRPVGGYYSQNEIYQAGHGFFGTVSRGLASVIEYTFQKAGRPNGYILGEDAGGAFVAGLRYGEGRLFTKDAGTHKVFWQGPTLGYDVGAEGSKTMVLVYNLRDPSEIYHRFGGVQGTAYLVGGVGVQFQKYGDVILAPIRSGIGLRLGANVGYLKYTRSPTWNPF